MACVIVPAAMNGVRSCGMREVSSEAAVWLGTLDGPRSSVKSGVILTAGISGAPAIVVAMPSALIVVPWGMDAMRAPVRGSFGSVVLGRASHIPGLGWRRRVAVGFVMSVTVCKYGTPFRKMSR